MLELYRVSKAFGANYANRNVSLKVHPGEVVSVTGENGAGKSTLMKMIVGLLQPDTGSLLWDGKETVIRDPADARKLGIGIVMQHFALFDELTVFENLYIHASLVGSVEKSLIFDRINQISEKFGIQVDLTTKLCNLSVGERQKIEILRCLIQPNLRLLILDEPTSVLTNDETKNLLRLLRKLSNSGCSIIYISHKLQEVEDISETVIVLRKGEVVSKFIGEEINQQQIAEAMLGDEITLNESAETPNLGDKIISVSGLVTRASESVGASLKGIDLDLFKGGVLGIAGVAGNGQDAFIDALSGEVSFLRGNIFYDGVDITGKGVSWRVANGVHVVPADRLERPVVKNMTLQENYYLRSRLFESTSVTAHEKNKKSTKAIIEEFSVACKGEKDLAENLSGGNLQKFIIGRELSFNPRVFICHQPTWGVDFSSAMFIHQQLRAIAAQGASVVILSEDLEELYAHCDQLAVIFDGHLSPVKAKTDTSIEEMAQLMTGMELGQEFARGA